MTKKSKTSIEKLLDQIACDVYNIQVLLNRLPHAESKGEYRSIGATIKVIVKEIHNARVLVENKVWYAEETVVLPLFHAEPSPVSIKEHYKELDSYFGELE